MNTGQMLLTICAIMIFGTQVLRVNSSESSTSSEVGNSKYGIMAIALARSRIDRAFSLKFDEQTILGNALPNSQGNPADGSFTAAGSLGCGSDERTNGIADENKFDDFDDYHNFTFVVDTLPSAIYTVTSTVRYVNPSNGFANSSTITWDKQMTVTVTSRNLLAPVTLSAINSYWRYN